jgi:hypothetical protein
MFVERKVRYSSLFTDLVGWHANAVIFPLSDVIFAQLACPLSDVLFCLNLGITNLSLYKHWVDHSIDKFHSHPEISDYDEKSKIIERKKKFI